MTTYTVRVEPNSVPGLWWRHFAILQGPDGIDVAYEIFHSLTRIPRWAERQAKRHAKRARSSASFEFMVEA